MRSEKGSAVYRARWIIPVAGPPIENGRLEVVDGCIASVQRASGPGGDALDLGDVAVLPGLVNAHTHLQLTFCRGRVPYRGSFTQWIRDLASPARQDLPGSPETAIEAGLRESLQAGVVAVADIGHGRAAAECWRRAPLAVIGFHEVLGIGPRARQDHERSFEAAARVCEKASSTPAPPTFGIGLSPHAPYSTDPAVYRQAIAFCRRTGRPICTHLAETSEEWQFLADATGPFRELLEEWGLWDGSFESPGCSPVSYAHRLGLLACRPLLAHVNYASDEDLDLLAGSGASVAYCPRTHRFFEHQPHRYAEMLRRGINVCIGTDSLASNETLSVLDELRFLRREDRHLSDEQLLTMATLAGAKALGLEDRIGSLSPGKRADFVVVPLDNPATREPLADVLTSTRVPSPAP
ncbi:MAG TPA: amidohydrolase family protein [Phycisphaerae bacterium]|nr:amidohydrolase family protein [Phycisphaerae bacterium]HOB72912.1 amidohydrolase family protein [Phycisphaerae bacterium]HOJ53039.1 amidohydrolase family protein [Phycisphaerae bacterium]HOL24776.1 amidohydrolase family protein [Phycisphaerae bacterium]HPP19312.1 amidohydrolase family protein [Phycisphaerae bacterium]